MGSLFWWFKILSVGLLSLFFLLWGIQVLVGAYDLDNPQLFIMYFFSGSFMTLISIVGILYPIFQIYALLQPKGIEKNGE